MALSGCLSSASSLPCDHVCFANVSSLLFLFNSAHPPRSVQTSSLPGSVHQDCSSLFSHSSSFPDYQDAVMARMTAEHVEMQRALVHWIKNYNPISWTVPGVLLMGTQWSRPLVFYPSQLSTFLSSASLDHWAPNSDCSLA